jgi:AraC-like DNA-binding protein/mannose-6-phosphate isomerase-like protein (cupin superfamily)
MNTQHISEFATLHKALKKTLLQLEWKNESSVLIGTKTQAQFNRQKLEPHNKVVRRKIEGKRITTRDRRHNDQNRVIAARWPQDHLHEATEPSLYFFLDGKADMRISNYSVQCLPGDIVLIPAGIPQSDGSVPLYVEVTPESSCDLMMFSPGLVSGRGLECSIGHSRGDKYIGGAIDERCWVQNILLANVFAGLCDELQTKGNSKSSHYLLLLLFVLFTREIEEGKALKGWLFSTLSTPHVKKELFRRALEHIQDHFSEPLTIDSVARQIAVSRAVFTRGFQHETGQTFKEYLTVLRLKQAEILLEKTHVPIETISAQVGLSPGRLRGLFRLKHGCSPTDFRTRVKNHPK